jgi:hypothetical protein
LDIVFDFPRTVTGLLGDLAGGLLFHEPLGADDRLLGDGTAHVVDGPAAWEHLTGLAFVRQNIIRKCVDMNLEQERDVGEAEHRPRSGNGSSP